MCHRYTPHLHSNPIRFNVQANHQTTRTLTKYTQKKISNLASPISTSKSSTKHGRHGTKPRSFTKARAGLASPKPPQLSCSTASRSSLAARCARCACRELWILEGEAMVGNYGCLPGILDMKLWKILFFARNRAVWTVETMFLCSNSGNRVFFARKKMILM